MDGLCKTRKDYSVGRKSMQGSQKAAGGIFNKTLIKMRLELPGD
jgi:hypothetical protein